MPKKRQRPSSDEITRRLHDLTLRQEERAVVAQGKHYVEAADRMVEAARGYQPTRTWLLAYMAAVQTILHQLTRNVAATALRHSHRAQTTAYYVQLWSMYLRVNDQAPLKLDPPAGLEALLRADIYDELIASLLGTDFTAQFADQIDLLVPQIKIAVSQGMTAGEGMADIMRRVRTVMGLDTDRRRGPVGSPERAGYRANFNRVQVITRTVVNTASNNGAYEAYQKNSDILTGYEWRASPTRACPQCQSLNGTIYRLTDTFRPPAHPNCRCAISPVIDPKWIPSAPEHQDGFTAFLGKLNVGADLGLIDW